MTILLLLCSCSKHDAVQKTNTEFYSWASTPPLGWNSWDCYGPTVTESEVKANADYMAENLKKHGWEYIVVDIRWYVNNDKTHGYNQTNPVYNLDKYGRLSPSVERFPSAVGKKGFASLAEYIHDKGLKFGIHIMRGIPVEAVKENTPILGSKASAKDIYSSEGQCTWLRDMYTVVADSEGAQAYYNSLFQLYASWGVDYVKVDDLSKPYHAREIELIRNAIDQCGRAIVLSTSPGETPVENAEHIVKHANLWRIVGDFWDNWPQVKEHFAVCNRWSPYSGIGHWPDADMLPLGRIGIRAERGDERMSQLSHDEQITVMSLFSIFKSPLMFGGDLPGNDTFTEALITNDEVLYVNQHSANNKQLYRDGGMIAWTADDPKTGDKFVALFNASDQEFVDEQKAIWKSELITQETASQSVDVNVDISGAKKIYLVATQGDQEYTKYNVDWIGPVLLGPEDSLNLTDLKWEHVIATGKGPNLNKGISGDPLIVNGQTYVNGIGTYANSIIEYRLPQGYHRLIARAGLDKSVFMPGSFGIGVEFMVFIQDPSGEIPPDSTSISVSFDQMGLTGQYRVRDLWNKKDIGVFKDEFSRMIRRHGSGLYRFTKLKE